MIVLISYLVVAASLWLLIYCTFRIVVRKAVMFEDMNLPSADDLHAMYEANNAIIRGENI